MAVAHRGASRAGLLKIRSTTMRLEKTRRHCAAAVLLLLAAVPLKAGAQSPTIPIFWDENEQISKPDLSTRDRVRFLTTTDFAPFNFLDAEGRLTGFHVDLARAICNELKIADRCQIQALPWSELAAAIEDKQGEAIIAGMAVTPANREKYVFSRAYLQFPARFVVARSSQMDEPIADRVKGKAVGVIAGSAHQKMLGAYFAGATVKPFDTADAMLAALKEGKLDAVFGDGMRLSFWLADAKSGNCCKFAGGPYLAPDFLGEGLAIAVRSDDPQLAQAFDYALHEIGVKGIFAELYLRYFPVGFY